jgi:iron complex outermembrane receptor protein
MLKILMTTVLSVCLIPVFAQFKLSGKVRDAQTQEPISGATVQIKENNLDAITDASGDFSFPTVSGAVTITVRFAGFGEETQLITVDRDMTIEILLGSIQLKEEVVVLGTRASEKSPFTFSTVDKPSIQKQNFGQDMPMLLNWTPSVVTTSDAGAGVGYTGIRIRGSDATRINVTINGIPYNDSESQGVYWVDVPDVASSTQSIQIQRGVGTSSNGAGAFGASINLQTNTLRGKPYADVINSVGSFNTWRHTVGAGTGKMENNFSFDVRASVIKSDGFIDRATSDLQSYYASGGYYGKNTIVKAIAFGGKEITYQSWYGIPESRLKGDVSAMQETAATEGWNSQDIDNLLNSNSRTFNHYRYKDQVDNYKQNHFQFHVSQKLHPALTGNVSLHATLGKGFYEEFKSDASFSNYGVTDVIIGGEVISSSDLVRRRWLDNRFYGMTFSLQLEKDRLTSILGGGWNQYDGDHFGEITWAAISASFPKDFQYYFNNGVKNDFNLYWKNTYQATAGLNLFADLQVRTIDYKSSGVENSLSYFNFDQNYSFFNPKAGVSYQVSANTQLYASVAVAHREPVRDDFVDALPGATPKPESLIDLEGGIRFRKEKMALNINGYYMSYKNQLVLTGAINDVGATIRTNVDKSYRAGVELDGNWIINPKFTWNANLTLSQNKIQNFGEVLYDYGDNFDQFNVIENNYKNTDISFSPNVIAGSNFTFNLFKGFDATLLTKYVGSQFLDNTSNGQRQIDSYFTNDLRLTYLFSPKGMNSISTSLLLNNLLNEEYESNGYTYGFLGGATTYRQNYYYPQAGRNFMLMLALRF